VFLQFLGGDVAAGLVQARVWLHARSCDDWGCRRSDDSRLDIPTEIWTISRKEGLVAETNEIERQGHPRTRRLRHRDSTGRNEMSASGRDAILNELLERNQRRIGAIARAYAPPSDAGDLIQEILLQVWRSLDHFRERSTIDTWVYRIALNVALSWKRSARRRQRWLPREAVDPDSLCLDHADESREERILREFLASLGEIDRAVLLLYLDNLGHQQMSEILGMTANAVSVRLHRIRRRFEARYLRE
jgi:RNA polymerase sigma-70 factor (ECF subfamily)